MKPEKPVRVVRHSGKHKTETRVFAREIYESYCAQPGCKFKGKRAAQGVCFSKPKGPDLAYLKRLHELADDAIADMRKISRESKETQGQYIDTLEAYHQCHVMNMESIMRELVHLRIENAKLKLKTGEWR